MPVGIDAGKLLVVWDAGLKEVAATTFACPRTDANISAMAGATILAGIAYVETRPARAILIPTALPYTSMIGPPHSLGAKTESC